MTLSLKQIRYFVAAAEQGQVSKAAIELNISQSAITAAIKQLEEMLEVRLFDREPSGVSLTFEGHKFLEHARLVETAVDEAVRFPRRSNHRITGTVRLVVSYTVAGYYLPSYQARFRRSFPNIEIDLTEANRDDIEDGLVAGRYDLAIMLTSNLMNQEDLAYETLIRSRRRLWLSSDHPLLSQASTSLKDVAEEPYIMLTIDEASNTAQKYWNRTPHRPNVMFRTRSVEAVRSMVANGMGISILSDMVYRPWSLEGRRVEVKSVADDVPTMDLGLVWNPSPELSEATTAFFNFMHLAVGPEQP